MPRAHFSKAVLRRVSGTPADGTVAVQESGTSTPLAQPLYAADSGTVQLANPIPFSGGVVEFFLDVPQRVRLVITPSGGVAQTFDAIDVSPPAQPYLPVAGKAADADRLDGLDSTAFAQVSGRAQSYIRLFLTGQ